MQSGISRHRALTTIGTIFLSLIFVQLPTISSNATLPFCVGAAAYPPELPGSCLDPVVEAQRVAAAEASAAASAAASASAAAEAAARQAEIDKKAQEAILLQLKNADFAAAAAAAKKLAEEAETAKTRALEEFNKAKEAEERKKAEIEAQIELEKTLKQAKKDAEGLAIRLQNEALELQKIVLAKQEEAATAQREYKAQEAALLAEIDKRKLAEKALADAAKEEEGKRATLAIAVQAARNQLSAAENSISSIEAQIAALAPPAINLRASSFIQVDPDDSATISSDFSKNLESKSLAQLQSELAAATRQKEDASSTISRTSTQLEAARIAAENAATSAKAAEAARELAETNQRNAAKVASDAANAAATALSDKIEKDNAALKAASDAAQAEVARAAAETAAQRRQAEMAAVLAAKAAAEAASAAASARFEALDKTADKLKTITESSGNAAEAAAEAVKQLNEANTQSNNASKAAADAQAAAAQSNALAEKTAQDAQDALDRQRAAEEDLRIANERAAEARRVAEAAAAARAAAEAAGKPKPMSDKEYSLLVAAAKKEAEEAAVKKAVEEKAKADAEEAAKKEEDAKKAAVDPNQAAVDAARKIADAAIAEAERLAAKADADIAAANAKAAAAIEAAKAKAQQIIDGIKSNLGKVASSASAAVDKYRGKASQSSDKAVAAKQVLDDANAKVVRTAEIVAAVATDFKTLKNQISNLEERAQIQVTQEKIQSAAITKTQSEIQQAIKNYEQIRLDISSYLLTYNAAKKSADEASRMANQKRDIVARSKIIADNAVGAYKEASGVKNLISTEKPSTVASAPDGVNVQTKVSPEDLAKLKQLADQAVARYNLDAKAADIAQQAAEKLIAVFEKVRIILEAKVAKGKKLQESIRSMQDELKVKRGVLEQTTSAKDALFKKIRIAQSKATQTRNELTIAQVEAQKAKVIAEKVKLLVARHQNDLKNANTVVDANQIAVEAAKQAAIDIEASSNSIDKIVASSAVTNSIASLPLIFSAVAIAAAAAFFGTLAVRRYRRRGSAPLPTFTEPDLDIQFDFDRILAEIRSKEDKRQARATTTKATTVRKTTVKKAAPKKR